MDGKLEIPTQSASPINAIDVPRTMGQTRGDTPKKDMTDDPSNPNGSGSEPTKLDMMSQLLENLNKQRSTKIEERIVTQENDSKSFQKAEKKIRDVTTSALTKTEKMVLRIIVSKDREVLNLPNDQLAFTLRDAIRSKCELTEGEVKALDDYQGKEYKTINKFLRERKMPITTQEKERIELIMSAVEKCPKTKDMSVHRILSFSTREECVSYLKQFQEGVYVTPQFESTTRKKGGGSVILPDNKPFQIQLVIQATGYHGGEISSVISLQKKSEGETLYPPGTRFSVNGEISHPQREHHSGDPFTTTINLTELEALDETKRQIQIPSWRSLFEGTTTLPTASRSAVKNLRSHDI